MLTKIINVDDICEIGVQNIIISNSRTNLIYWLTLT